MTKQLETCCDEDCRDWKPQTCTHPPEKLYTWFARDDNQPSGMMVCVGCCQCGAILRGSTS